jgi:hypothetical protein
MINYNMLTAPQNKFIPYSLKRFYELKFELNEWASILY